MVEKGKGKYRSVREALEVYAQLVKESDYTYECDNEDFMELHDKLKKLSEVNIQYYELLLDYYVAKMGAKFIAADYHVDPSTIGGLLSAGLRAFRKILGDLVQPLENGEKARDRVVDDITKKRNKVSRRLEKRWRMHNE